MFGLTFDWVNFFNTILGATLGGLLSLGISYYFFVRGSGLVTLMHWLSHNLGDSYIKQQYPQFFGPHAIQAVSTPIGSPNLDVPRLQTVVFSNASTTPGGRLEILCRVADEGFNFSSTNGGLTILDYGGNQHQVTDVGYGFMLAVLKIPAGEAPGVYKLTFNMQDTDLKSGLPVNKFSQTVTFKIA